MRNRIRLADVSEKLVTETLAFRCARDETRDVYELHGGWDHLLRMNDLRKLVESRIRHRHHACVRIDRAERKVLGGDSRLGQRVEQRRLADVRQTDDSAIEAHQSFSLVDVCRMFIAFKNSPEQ